MRRTGVVERMSKRRADSATSVSVEAVSEVQGLYGAFTFPERLLQKIWHRGDFDGTAARTTDGRAVQVLHPGRWNHLGGPDFAGARLRIDDREATGDVELHLHAKDWDAHGHASDAAYDNVVLHVVLFPCAGIRTRGAGGREIPVLCLLPLLHHGLEEYAADEAMEQLAGRPLHHAQEALGRLGIQELDAVLRMQAGQRWRTKVHHAGERIRRLGWVGACHHAALEILGYRSNRAPMLSAATELPLAEWAAGRVDPDQVFAGRRERWNLQGVRPLNHPRLRLRQYADWCAARPDWPERLRRHAGLRALAPSSDGAGAGAWRRSVALTALRTSLCDAVCAGTVGGGRWDNLVGDGFLPLLAAHEGLEFECAWRGWFAGDAPESIAGVLRALGAVGGRDRPLAQGPVQGLLGWILAGESQVRG